jgi:hypothetical protein
MWLIGAAAWRPWRVRVGTSAPVSLERGEFVTASGFLAEKWIWSKSRVSRFLIRLEKRDIIRDTSRDGAAVFIIRNYNRFQVVGIPQRDSEGDDNGDSSGTAAGQQRDKEETFKHLNIETDDDAARARTLRSLKNLRNPQRQTHRQPGSHHLARQVAEMLRDGVSEAEIIAATEVARTHGKLNLNYIRAVAFGPKAQGPPVLLPSPGRTAETNPGARLKQTGERK